LVISSCQYFSLPSEPAALENTPSLPKPIITDNNSSSNAFTDQTTIAQQPVHGFVFEAYDNSKWDIIYMKDDGSVRTNLTERINGSSKAPSWSADGRRIAFVSNRDGKYQIYVMDFDGSNIKCLTNSEHGVYLPCISPNGMSIAYPSFPEWVLNRNRYEAYLSNDILIIDTQGQTIVRIKPDSNDLTETLNLCPVWSPDGTKIAFVSLKVGYAFGATKYWTTFMRNKIFIYDLSDKSISRIEGPEEADDNCPCWSGDSRHIAFLSSRDDIEYENSYIYIADSDGKNVKRITLENTLPPYAAYFLVEKTVDLYGGVISWSPDGRYLANSTQIIDMSGKSTYFPEKEAAYAFRSWISGSIAWSPDGSRAAYVPRSKSSTGREPSSYIILIDPDGSNQVTLMDCRVRGFLSWR
jgi:Tol biopolymer transport system component